MKKIELLNLVADKAANCNKCLELSANRTKSVFGNGNPNSNLMVVAEAPGRNEDEQGMPLVGKAGILWNNILASVNLKREDIYHCNCVKCRPPDNRKPTKEECDNCRPFLDLQIEIIKPKMILCLGAVAANNLLKNDAPIGSLRKTWFDYRNGIKLFCTYHPSYAVRRGDEIKREIWEDMKLFVESITND